MSDTSKGKLGMELFTAAAGIRHRGTARPDPQTLIARVKMLFEDDNEET